jgi:hypothetical protein
MKKITILLLLIAIMQIAKAQTVLQPGDVAIVQVNYTYNSFDFVCFVDIEAGTKIRFTDYVYSSTLSNLDQTSTSDGIYEYTAPNAISAGTVVQYKINTTVNAAFATIAGGSFSLRSYKNNYALAGENLIAYQQNAGTKTYLFALGWMRKDNFAPNPSNANAKVCDIPTGLSKANYTVIQIDSVMGSGQTPQLARDFRYNKYNGFTGTAFMLRRNLADVSNYNKYSGASNNTAVGNFGVLPFDNDAPELLKTTPENNANAVSVYSNVVFSFNENVLVAPSKHIILRNTNNGATSYHGASELSVSGKDISLTPPNNLAHNASYRVEVPAGCFTDENNNPWPTEPFVLAFNSSDKRSVVKIDFLNDPKENLTWTTTNTSDINYQGYWDFDIKGVSMRWYNTFWDMDVPFHASGNKVKAQQPFIDTIGPVNLISDASLTINTSGIINNITHIRSQLYQNCVEMQIKMFSGNKAIVQNSIDGCIPEEDWLYRQETISDGWGGTYSPHYINHDMSNESSSKIDSLKYINSEGHVLQIELEIIDNATPQVNLGDDRKICRGDSVLLDAGPMVGAEYNWSNNATTQKIWVKETGDYSVTVKNTLGEATDIVNVQVLDPIVTILPDTIYACPGDTVTLVAGDDNYGYFWSVRYPQDTPIRKVTESGVYPVIISNGACLVIDSVRVIYRKGARLNASFLQGGMTGYEDVEGQLYKENSAGRFELYKTKNMPQIVFFDSLPAGNYVLKAQFVQYTHANSSSFYSTYHDGNIMWPDVQAFTLTCESDTTINFLLASRESNFDFNGTGIITGKVAIQNNSDTNISLRMKARSSSSCDTQVMLLDGNGNIIATQCPDANGNYSFENLPHGNYSIAVERAGFEQPILFSATIDAQNPTVSNANFVIDENTQSISQGVVSSIQNKDISHSTQLKMWPNPTNDGNTSIEFDAPSKGQYNIRIINLNGQIIHNFEHELAQGTNTIELPRIQQSGMYIVRVSASLFSANAKLVVE